MSCRRLISGIHNFFPFFNRTLLIRVSHLRHTVHSIHQYIYSFHEISNLLFPTFLHQERRSTPRRTVARLHYNPCRKISCGGPVVFINIPRARFGGYLRRPKGGNSRTVRCFGTAASEHSIPALRRRTILFPCTVQYVKPRPPVDCTGNPAGSDYCVHNT